MGAQQNIILLRVIFKVGILTDDVVAGGHPNTGVQRGALAHVHGVCVVSNGHFGMLAYATLHGLLGVVF